MPAPIQRPDLGELMKSFEAIANSKAADDKYVYVKHGKAHTESRASHWFTSSDCKSMTAQWLQAALKERYGHDVGDPLACKIAGYAYGAHQLKVGDLRRLFVEGQAKVLAQVAQTLAEKDEALGDALAPLTKRINEDRVVTERDMGAVLAKKFGHQASVLVVAANEGARLSALPALMDEAAAAAHRLSALPQVLAQALVSFCARGSTKAVLMSLLKERFAAQGLDVTKALAADLGRLPEKGITQEKALAIFEKALSHQNQQKIKLFMAKVNDPLACRITGLDSMCCRNAKFSREVQHQVNRALPEARRAADALRQAASDVRQTVLGENGRVSERYQDFERQQLEHLADAKKTSAQDVAELKTALETRLRRETSFDYAVDYEIGRHDWTAEQAQLYRDAMTFIRSKANGTELFVQDRSVSDVIAQHVSGDGVASLSMVEDKAAFLKALAIAGESQASWILQHMEEVSAAFRAGDVSAEQLFRLLYGEAVAETPDLNRPLDSVHTCFRQEGMIAMCEKRVMGNWTVTDAMKASARETALARNPALANNAAELEREVQFRVETMRERRPMDASAVVESGLTFEAALAHLDNNRLSLGLDDFAKPPVMSHGGHYAADDAEACWLADFVRQQAGTVVSVLQPEGKFVKADNSQEGLAANELQAFLQRSKTSKHESVMRALKTLCGGNDKQYVLAMVALSQSGPAGLWKNFGAVVDGGGVEDEHSALEYLFTKRSDGNVVVDFKSPDADGRAKLLGTVIIRPDGTAYYESLSITPRDVKA